MSIKPHCMGMEFPKRDTDGPNVKWVSAFVGHVCPCTDSNCPVCAPSAADLDAVAEEQRVKEKTGAQVPSR